MALKKFAVQFNAVQGPAVTMTVNDVEAECAAMMKSMEKEQVAAAAKIQANFRGNQVMESARACRCYFSEQVQETC